MPISKALHKYLNQSEVVKEVITTTSDPSFPLYIDLHGNTYTHNPDSPHSPYGAMCADCGQTSVYMSEGCMTCKECGWSQC